MNDRPEHRINGQVFTVSHVSGGVWTLYRESDGKLFHAYGVELKSKMRLTPAGVNK